MNQKVVTGQGPKGRSVWSVCTLLYLRGVTKRTLTSITTPIGTQSHDLGQQHPLTCDTLRSRISPGKHRYVPNQISQGDTELRTPGYRASRLQLYALLDTMLNNSNPCFHFKINTALSPRQMPKICMNV